ncbi:hypothetical protein F4805DRAFT_416232 [Annulohypoxylon moriforme]|nr:hypothetical protein F4805DRAFT_416232 [Annulohypoxylon moriforme]
MSRASGKVPPTLRTSPSIRCNPYASKPRPKVETIQRDIFDWYEKCEYKYDAGAIFSPEWQDRLTEWGEESNRYSMSDICENIKSQEQNPEELELGHLFLAHPVAAFALWHVLQSCYELDMIICGTTMENRKSIAEWQKWRPFQYLLSRDIVCCWQDNMCGLLSEAESCTNKFQKEKIDQRLQRISQAIHALKEAIATLASVFEDSKEKLTYTFWILKVVEENVDKRWPQMANTQKEDGGQSLI